MTNNDGPFKEMLTNLKPDHAMAMEAIRKANATIVNLTQQIQASQSSWMELFLVLATILNKFGKEIYLEERDLIALSPDTYQITVEAAPMYKDEGTVEGRVVRLKAREVVGD